jgi:hypothetical protein
MRASQALADHPEKSNRAIAAEVGVGVETIRRARLAGGSNGSPDKTIGLDGKVYPSRRKKIERRQPSEEEYYSQGVTAMAGDIISLTAILHRSYGDNWKEFSVASDLKTLVQQAADAWNEFNEHIQTQDERIADLEPSA